MAGIKRALASAPIDPFLLMLVGAAALGIVVPVTGGVLDGAQQGSNVAIGALFFLYGARLSTAETWAGLRRWPLHLAILGTTFVAFPALGWGLVHLPESVLHADLAAGVLLLCLVPSTIQSNVVNTRIAGGNTAAAVVSASMSNVIGVFLTPLLVAWLLSAQATIDAGSILRIVAMLLAPFVLGQVTRRWTGEWVARHDTWLKRYDRGTIILVVYLAFSAGSEADLWSQVEPGQLAIAAAVCVGVLAAAMTWTWGLGRLMGLELTDRWPLLFCGSNKSLASGLPMASVLFAGQSVALLVLPLMIYHQLQIITGSVIASRAARRLP